MSGALLCFARRCSRPRPPGKLMCAPCWAKVPAALQARVHETHRAMQRRESGGMKAYIRAIRQAREAVGAAGVGAAVLPGGAPR